MPFGPWPGTGGGGGGAWPGNGGAPPAIGAASAAGGGALTSSFNHTHKAAPISTVYGVGAAAADQTAAVLDAKGGGVVLDGSGAGNTLGPVLTLKGSGGLTDAPAIIDGGDISGRALHFKNGATTLSVDSVGGLALAAALVSMDVTAGRGFQVDAAVNLALGFQSALAAVATNGFAFTRSMPAPPTGVPAASYGAAVTAMSARVFNTRDHDANDWDPVAQSWVPSASVARWPIASTRWYAVDGALGDDKLPGFSDVSSAAAGLVAKKTFAGLAAIFPLNGANRKAVIVVASGTYVGGLQVFLAGVAGYAADFPLVLPTITNASASAVAFAGDANDKIMAGFVTATGMNAAGYTPTGAGQTALQCTLFGGGAPGFPAEAAAPIPMGLRIRFDVATTTVALRNVCVPIQGISAADTLTLPNVATGALFCPVAWAATDKFYIEMAGLNVDQTFLSGQFTTGNSALASHAFGPPQIVGVSFATGLSIRNTPIRLVGCIGIVTGNAQLATSATFNDEAGTARLVGCGLRNTGALGLQFSLFAANVSDANQTLVATGSLSMTDAVGFNIANGCYFAAGVSLSNVKGDVTGDAANVQTISLFGGRTTNNQSPVRIRGTLTGPAGICGLSINFSTLTFGRLDIASVGGNPAIRLNGQCSISIGNALTGTAGNTDVGLDLTNARMSTIILLAPAPTLSGVVGDIRLADGTIATWAQALAGIVDTAGNILQGAATSPLHPTAVAAGAVAMAITNAPAGSPATFARYVKVPDGVGGFYTYGSLT